MPAEGQGYNRAYSFAYDELNRLTEGKYTGGTVGAYNESFAYDKMGNITNFVRYGVQSSPGITFGKIDDLTLEHTGNQLKKVTDYGNDGIYYGDEEFIRNTANSGNSCAYDANGNRLYDSNSSVWAIKYNTLNLPDAMQFYQGHQTNYTYSAAGIKLKVVDKTAPEGVTLPVSSLNTILSNPSVSSITTTDYAGNYIYENGSLKRILLPEGYYQGGYYYYFLKDHLGSNRVVLRNDGYIAETSNYYPSGMRFGESIVNGGNVQPYRHTGHEMQAMHGLNWIDNNARFRTVSDGGGFTGVDPLAEKYFDASPYSYCLGDPVNNVDPFGMDVWTTSDPDQIDQFVFAVRAGFRTFSVSSSNWSHFSDNDFRAGLSMNEAGGFTYQYGTVEDGVFTTNLMRFPNMRYTSDPDSHYDPITGYYNLYTANETNGALKTYAGIAGGEILGPALGAIIGRGVGRIASGIAERLAAKEGAQGFKSLGAAAKGFSKNILPEGFKQTKQFGYQHGQKVYEYMGKYFSRDIDGHNGGVWKVFEAVGGKLKRIGTADETLTIFKK